MKIATWNVERLKPKKVLNLILDEIKSIDAYILILTEYDQLLDLTDYQYKIETEQLPSDSFDYAETERRVAIFSKYPILKTFETYDPLTSCCAEIETPSGNLIVYGTIVGILGNRDANYSEELEMQIEDIQRFTKKGNFCFAGDLNMSFSDNYYFTQKGRESFLKCFKENNLINLTEKVNENIDHVVMSQSFINESELNIYEWNTDKSLSDHKGICVEFNLKH